MATPSSPGLLRRRSGPVVIDVHGHLRVPEVTDFILRHLPSDHPERQLASRFTGTSEKRGEQHRQAGIGPVEARLKDMDRNGVDMMVISGQVSQYCYWAKGEEGVRIARLGNDRLAEYVAARPDRFIGMGTVPMQDIRAAIAELERSVNQLGFRGVMIATRIEGVDLDDERFFPFWEKAEQLGVAVFLHPAGLREPRFQKYNLWNGLGQPIEEAIAMCCLIYGGVMDRYPKLKICVVHGGGFLPFYAGRVDRNYRNRPEEAGIRREPSAYLPQFHYDTVLYNVDMLEFLVHKVGAESIVLGSDYPVGETDPVSFVKRARIPADDSRRIIGENAAKLFGISV